MHSDFSLITSLALGHCTDIIYYMDANDLDMSYIIDLSQYTRDLSSVLNMYASFYY